jgi:PTH1 family peptidyl-tRNA hydrolase
MIAGKIEERLNCAEIFLSRAWQKRRCGQKRNHWRKGSGGGHNGVKNILQLLGTKEIKRIRIGVGKNELIDQKDYVLGKFSKEEEPVMAQAYDKASEALVEYATHDFEYLMNKYNVKDE